MRSAAANAARLILLAGPTVLAFFSGGYFDGPRTWAGLAGWLLVAVAALAGTGCVGIPRGRAAVATIGGLALLAGWSLVSITWSPIAGNAYHASQVVTLYLGTLIAAALLLGGRRVRPLVEPALAAGTLIVVGYGVSGRLLPGLLHFARSVSAQGRLEQPLTYWNAMGELAAIGVVLVTRLAGDATRGPGMRIAAAAAAVPLGVGLYISFSRGALFACAAGLVALIAVAGSREQAQSVALVVVAAALAAVACAPFAGVTGLHGSLGTREGQGAIALALFVVLAGVAALFQRRLISRGHTGPLPMPRRTPLIAAALICAGLALAIIVGAKETSAAAQQLSGGANRLVSLRSNRYDYWRVALRAFGQQPLRGVGAGNWSVYWLRWRHFEDFAQDAHSLPLQTMAELGLVGLAGLLAFLGGIAVAARQALRATPLAAGPIAGFVAYIAHAPLDWDWEMPAVTLVAIILAGTLLALARPAAVGENAPPGTIRLRPAAP
ncbi:MAG TPA: O-antigen ligase family protein [Solirubrobacteraceae bacterium]|nr:O-antigen ligase family protein [Solirubrobacteraceae bacterium]